MNVTTLPENPAKILKTYHQQPKDAESEKDTITATGVRIQSSEQPVVNTTKENNVPGK